MRILRLILFACPAFAACKGDSSPRGNDTTETHSPPRLAPNTQGVAVSTWDNAVGPWFVVPSGNDPTAYVVLPDLAPDVALDTIQFDLTSLQQQRLELFNHGNAAGDGEFAIAAVDSTPDCPVWPLMQVRTSARTWNVAFQPGKTHVFPQDTLASLSSRDSSRLSMEVARLASAVPGDTSVFFRGRPFLVRQVVRSTVAAERTVLVAEILRTVNQEATPLQEHLLIIAEQNADVPGWSTVVAERSISMEEHAETTDVLAIFSSVERPEALLVLVSRDFGEGGNFTLFEQTTPGRWRVRWTSPFAGC